MANLVAIAYDDLDQAKEVMSTVGELVREHSLEVDDAVIVEKRQDGKIKLHQPSMGGAGAQRRALGWADRAHHSDAALRHGHRRGKRRRRRQGERLGGRGSGY
jgi:hypothetical protein